MPRTIQGIEQGRANFAYDAASLGRDIIKNKSILKYDNHFFKDTKYKSYVKSFPMMIKTNGLGAALAFVFSKRNTKEKKEVGNTISSAGSKANPKNAYDLIYLQINEWLHQEENIYLLGDKANLELAETIIQLNSSHYRAVTNEVLALFNWLRRFSEGLIEGEDENNG